MDSADGPAALRSTVDLALELYAVLVVIDVGLGWFEAPDRLPRRLTHPLTEPPQRLVRTLWVRARNALWPADAAVVPFDWSPVVVLGGCAAFRLMLQR